MSPSKSRVAARRPHVALLVETSLGSGRDILRGIAQFLRENESWALYQEPRGLEDGLPRWIGRWKGDGIIARIQNRKIAQQLRETGIPTVDVLGMVPEAGFPLVHVDNAKIATLAADHLLEKGFEHFGFFGLSGENWSEQRRNVFGNYLGKLGHDVSVFELPRRERQGESWEAREDALAAWVDNLPKPAGVLVCSDQRGPELLEACRRAEVEIPEQVAVVGVDNDEPLCETCDPSLSSVRANHTRVGYEAAALLCKLMRKDLRLSEPVTIPPQEVVARVSSDILAMPDPEIRRALRLIREEGCNGLLVDALAREVGLSRSVLQRRFRQTLHRTPHQEILNVRLKRATELLVRTQLSLAEVAVRTGFKHQEYMGAVFKERLGLTPAKFRKEARP